MDKYIKRLIKGYIYLYLVTLQFISCTNKSSYMLALKGDVSQKHEQPKLEKRSTNLEKGNFDTNYFSELAGNLISYYPFNGNFDDVSANHHPVSVYGAKLTFDKNGYPNSAVSFNGISDFISLGNLGVLPSEGSIVFLVKSDSKVNYRTIFSTDIKSRESIEAYYLNETFITSFSSTFSENNMLRVSILDNEWMHCVIKWSIPNKRIYLYKEGMESGYANNTLWPTNLNNVVLGTSYYGNLFQGIIDDFRIYNISIPESVIREIYQNYLSNTYYSSSPTYYPSYNSTKAPILITTTDNSTGDRFFNTNISTSTKNTTNIFLSTYDNNYTFGRNVSVAKNNTFKEILFCSPVWFFISMGLILFIIICGICYRLRKNRKKCFSRNKTGNQKDNVVTGKGMPIDITKVPLINNNNNINSGNLEQMIQLEMEQNCSYNKVNDGTGNNNKEEQGQKKEEPKNSQTSRNDPQILSNNNKVNGAGNDNQEQEKQKGSKTSISNEQKGVKQKENKGNDDGKEIELQEIKAGKQNNICNGRPKQQLMAKKDLQIFSNDKQKKVKSKEKISDLNDQGGTE